MTNYRWFGEGVVSTSTLDGILGILNETEIFSNDTRYIRDTWAQQLEGDGWVKDYFLGGTNMRIPFKRGKIGLCIQLGNVARFHSDLLKLGYLFEAKEIDYAVVVVPSDDYSKSLGSNHASFSRCERDLEAFGKLISVPVLLIEVNRG